MSSPRGLIPALAMLALLTLLPAGADAQEAHYRHHGPALLPDDIGTPGDVMTTDATKVCQPGYAASVRNVPESVKKQAYISYGAKKHAPRCCEVDHLISLQLGGSNDFKNLWPEPYTPHPGARDKDVLEGWLHRQVCTAKTMTLPEAQDMIRTDWYAAYLDMLKKTKKHPA